MSAPKRCVVVLNEALHELFERRDDVFLLGEDVLDPYGGAFKVTQGLSDRWPERVLTTPISEASLIGVAAGMALRGRRPILEIMFGDFIALGFDQIVNGVSKFREMFESTSSPRASATTWAACSTTPSTTITRSS
jgi:pyruvate/2-oxoglutarate/acetoin dehydrogenase E1 component